MREMGLGRVESETMDMQICLKIETDTLTQWQYCLLKTGVDNLTFDITLLTTAVSRILPSIVSQAQR